MICPRLRATFCTIAITVLTLTAASASAQSGALNNARNNLINLQQTALGTNDNPALQDVAAGVIGVVLSIVGLVYIGLVIYGGYLWGTARGNEERVSQGKKLIFEATVGTIIVFGAYFITAFVIQRMAIATFVPSKQQF